jgi:hypothetical protein
MTTSNAAGRSARLRVEMVEALRSVGAAAYPVTLACRLPSSTECSTKRSPESDPLPFLPASAGGLGNQSNRHVRER